MKKYLVCVSSKTADDHFVTCKKYYVNKPDVLFYYRWDQGGRDKPE